MAKQSPRCRRKKIYNMYAGQCFYCKKFLPLELSTIEHIVPVSKGGTNRSWNLAVCCAKVNQRRGNNSTQEGKKLCIEICPFKDINFEQEQKEYADQRTKEYLLSISKKSAIDTQSGQVGSTMSPCSSTDD